MVKKGDLSDFQHGMVVSARWAGLIISEIADLDAIAGVYRERSEKEKISREQQHAERKYLVDARIQRRLNSFKLIEKQQ